MSLLQTKRVMNKVLSLCFTNLSNHVLVDYLKPYLRDILCSFHCKFQNLDEPPHISLLKLHKKHYSHPIT